MLDLAAEESGDATASSHRRLKAREGKAVAEAERRQNGERGGGGSPTAAAASLWLGGEAMAALGRDRKAARSWPLFMGRVDLGGTPSWDRNTADTVSTWGGVRLGHELEEGGS